MRLHLQPPPLFLAFAGKGRPDLAPYGHGRRRLVERAREVDELAQVGRRIVLAVADMVLLICGLPAVAAFLWTHSEFQTPQGLGAVGGVLGLIGVVRTGADKLVRARKGDG